jgi:hypothetical protein
MVDGKFFVSLDRPFAGGGHPILVAERGRSRHVSELAEAA